MRNFSQFVTEPLYNKKSDTNEIVGVLLASACLAYACKPLLDGIGQKIAKSAEKSANDGFSFWDWIFGRNKKDDKDKKDKKDSRDDRDDDRDDRDDDKNKKDKKDKKDKKNKKDKKDKKDNRAFNTTLMIAKQSNKNEKNKKEKDKNDNIIKLLTACSFDKDGNEIPLGERINKVKDNMSAEQFEAFKKYMTKTYEKNKDNQDFKDALVKAETNIKTDDYEKMLNDAKKEAKAIIKQLDEEKKKIEEYTQKLNDIEKQIKDEKDKDKLKELKTQQTQLQQNTPTTIVSTVTGVTITSTTTTSTSDPKKEEDGYKVQDEEVEDPKTGKKIKVKTYTGPRGGKFYYPDGKPKKPENKVYVESVTLLNYLSKSID